MSSIIKKIAAASLAISLVAIPAAAEDADDVMDTLYDSGERALDFFALDRGARGVPDPVSTGSIAPRATFTSTAPVAPRAEWWAGHEAIRLAAEGR